MAEVSRDDAWQLVTEWIESDSLRKHLLGVEAAMRAYARKWGEDEETYAVTGLVHDLDYERYPDLETGHPRYAIKELEGRGYPQEVIDAVAGHADFMGVPRETRMAKTLYAVDELSGFIAACALVRPTGIEGMKPKSVKKKLKQPSFAAAVNRDEVQRGIEELGVDQDEHIALIIEALAERADELGLGPQEGCRADADELDVADVALAEDHPRASIAGLIVLLLLNALVVSNATKDAYVRDSGRAAGRHLDGTLQVLEQGNPKGSPDRADPLLHVLDELVGQPRAAARAGPSRHPGRSARPGRLGQAERRLLDRRSGERGRRGAREARRRRRHGGRPLAGRKRRRRPSPSRARSSPPGS